MGEHRWRGSSRPTGTGPAGPVSTARPTRARRAIVAAALTVAAGLGGAGAALAAPSDPPAAAPPTASPSAPADGRALRADLPLVGTAPHSATRAPASTRAADPAPTTATRSTTAPTTTTRSTTAPTGPTPTGPTPTTTTRTTAAPAPVRPEGVAGTPCTATARACVDLASRTAWLLDGDQVVRGPVAVQHGGHEYPTPVGTFTVQWKAEQYTSREFGSPMPYSVFFAPGGVAFHEGRQDTPSAGCVKLVHDDAVAWFSYLQVGDEVQIH